MKLAILVALVCAGVASGAAFPVSGTVVDDATGTSLPKPEVRAVGQRPPFVDFASKDDGSFQGDLPSGGYTVNAWYPGYAYSEIPASENPLVIRLVKLGAIEGRVTGLDGRVATVLALIRSGEIWKPVVGNFTRGVQVDGSGNFRIPDLPPGPYALLVAYANEGLLRYPDGAGSLELASGGVQRVLIPIPSNPVRTIAGTVELPDPQSWYWVTLSRLDQPALAVATTVSDEKGGFAFRGVAPGAYDLLAAPGTGERGAHSYPELPYHGFARAAADATKADVRDVKVISQQSIQVTVGLSEAVKMPTPGSRCYLGLVNLMPLEDWGIRLERSLNQVKIGNEPSKSSPEAIDGLAPAKYGVSLRDPGGNCLLAEDPVLDVTRSQTGSVEGNVLEPGTLKGAADAGSEVALIPDDFAEGWSYLPADWFSELPYIGGFRFLTWEHIPRVRLVVANAEGHFEFAHVPAGSYKVGIHGQEMKPIDIPPAGSVEIVLTVPK